ncbi:hypothetical protein [Streptomyces broussonetiae]|uniref:Uncharacterized protein n=1 Tax=Streptomyces broussonetiae TaxID=2686304 RepID=A0ABV5E5C2_9ACTN
MKNLLRALRSRAALLRMAGGAVLSGASRAVVDWLIRRTLE